MRGVAAVIVVLTTTFPVAAQPGATARPAATFAEALQRLHDLYWDASLVGWDRLGDAAGFDLRPGTAADGFHLLARIARRDQGLSPSETLARQLDRVCDQLDPATRYFPPGSPRIAAPTGPCLAPPAVDGRLGVIRVLRFGPTLPAEFDDQVARLRMDQVRGWIIDLRGCPGGSLTAAIVLAKRFLGGGVVLSSVGQGPANRVFVAPGPAAIVEPAAVLIDGRTASAAEAFAAALGDHGRATLVGMPSYGKAAVQQDVPLTDGGILRVTIARLRSPNGFDYHGRGIVPHIVETDPDRQLAAAAERLRTGR
jgi:hypothetical protein